VEDHGYILDIGISDVSGFISFEEAKRGPWDKNTSLRVGQLIDASIVSMSKNGRTCTMSVELKSFANGSVSVVPAPCACSLY
jgi:rRNA biogenesis protein RRP5